MRAPVRTAGIIYVDSEESRGKKGMGVICTATYISILLSNESQAPRVDYAPRFVPVRFLFCAVGMCRFELMTSRFIVLASVRCSDFVAFPLVPLPRCSVLFCCRTLPRPLRCGCVLRLHIRGHDLGRLSILPLALNLLPWLLTFLLLFLPLALVVLSVL